jgi:carbohydrate kinase (thermoresistant glucokinase family)
MTPTAIIVMGVSGCGKSSVAEALCARLLTAGLAAKLLEGDEFHPQANIEKMRSGQSLNDQDREPWLRRLNQELLQTLKQGQFAVLACSALKEKYRSLLGAGIDVPLWLHLVGSFELIETRMKARQHLYMPASLLRSQFETLEPPLDALNLSIETPLGLMAEKAFEYVLEKCASDAAKPATSD